MLPEVNTTLQSAGTSSVASKYEELECLYAAVGKVIYEGLTNYEKATNANPSQLFGKFPTSLVDVCRVPVNEYDLCHELLFPIRKLKTDTMQRKLWEVFQANLRDELRRSVICEGRDWGVHGILSSPCS